jgi:membrane protein
MLTKRALSLGMVLTIAFLLLVSLVLSALISAFGTRIGVWLPGGLSEAILQLLANGLTLALGTVLFGLIFKVMPDADIGWRDVGVGAFATAFMFVVGKYFMGEYFARTDPGEVFGAAGSLALVLLWIYYSAMILLFGAEFTQVWAQERGSGIRPDEDAVQVVEITKHL